MSVAAPTAIGTAKAPNTPVPLPLPTQTLKRSLSQRDSSVSPEGPPKRQKVAFDPDVKVQILPSTDDKPTELVRAEVRSGIEQHISAAAHDEHSVTGNGSTENGWSGNSGYDHLKQLFTTKAGAEDAPSSQLLLKYLIALRGHANLLDRRCSGLVHAVMETQWLGRDDAFVIGYLKFLGALLSAHGGWSSPVVKSLVDKFVDLRPKDGRLPGHPVVTRAQMCARLHRALKYLTSLIPSASAVLSPVLSASFPFASDSQKAHIDYIKNLLTMTEYLPELKAEVLTLITDRLVKIDVQTQVDIEDLEDDLEDILLAESYNESPQNRLEDDSDISDTDSVSGDDSDGHLDDKRVKELKASISKMDAILDILFAHYTAIFSTGKSYVVDSTFEHLLLQFANTILPTYRSRHTQFLLFHFGQQSEALIDKFVGACAHLAFDRNRSAIMRIAAASYLASFVARGKHVKPLVVREVFNLLAWNADQLREQYEPGCRGPDLRRYSVYYAMIQAMLYIFCLRWRDLTMTPEDESYYAEFQFGQEDLTWLPEVKEILTRNIFSKLNPLKVCSPVVVDQFARIAMHLRFMYVYPKIDANKRLRLSQYLSLGTSGASSMSGFGAGLRETALTSKTGESYFQLESFFPFDPYHLPLSKKWVESSYKRWESPPGLDDDDRDDPMAGSSDTESIMGAKLDDDEFEESTGTDEA